MFEIYVVSFTLKLMNYFVCISMNIVEWVLLCISIMVILETILQANL